MARPTHRNIVDSCWKFWDHDGMKAVGPTHPHGFSVSSKMNPTRASDDIKFCITGLLRLQLILPWDGDLRTFFGHRYRRSDNASSHSSLDIKLHRT